MNIIQIIPYLFHGVGRVVADLSCKLSSKGHNITIITSKNRDGEYYNQKELIEQCHKHNVNIIMLDSVFKRDIEIILSSSRILTNVIQQNHTDIINAH